jgi:ATP-dependent protease Clp ATPase subunit
MRCSFCHKSQDKAGKLISSPSDYPRAYICDECIEVCNDILKDEGHELPPVPEPCGDGNSVWNHPLASDFLEMVERWVVLETEGRDASPALTEMKRIAAQMKAP